MTGSIVTVKMPWGTAMTKVPLNCDLIVNVIQFKTRLNSEGKDTI